MMKHERENWRTEGECVKVDPEIFFVGDGKNPNHPTTQEAKKAAVIVQYG